MRKIKLAIWVTMLVWILGNQCAYTQVSGLIGHYPFNGNANDESGQGNHGTAIGAVLTTDRFGIPEKAYQFDGVDDMIELLFPLPIENSFTITFWVLNEMSDVQKGNILCDGSVNYGGNDFLINVTGNRIGIRADKEYLPLNYEDYSPTELSNISFGDNWHFITWVMTPEKSRIYVNDSLIAEVNIPGTNKDYHDEHSYIGTRYVWSNPDDFFKGKIDDICIYDRPLSQEEIIAQYRICNFAGLQATNTSGFVPLNVELSAFQAQGASFEWYFNGELFDSTALTNILLNRQYDSEIILKTTGPSPWFCVEYDTVKVMAVYDCTLGGIETHDTIGSMPVHVILEAFEFIGASYEWYYDGAQFSTDEETNLFIENYGESEIVLKTIIPEPTGCTVYDTIKFDIIQPEPDYYAEIFIPNSFTPNNDGFNDTFGPVTEGIQWLEMHIKDRNGRLVCTIDKPDGRWDGKTTEGFDAPQGVYYYTMEAIGFDYKHHTRQGSITLINKLIDDTPTIISIIPNPVSHIAKIYYTAPMFGEVECSIYSCTGELVMKTITSKPFISLDISSWKQGVYIIQITTETHLLSTKLVKV